MSAFTAVAVSLDQGVVIDNNKFKKLSIDQANAVMIAARRLHSRILLVESCSSFFTGRNLIELIEANSTDWDLVASKLGVDLSAAEARTIHDMVRLREKITEACKGKYVMVPVPKDWNIASHYGFTKSYMRRNNHYTLSNKVAERVWKLASNVWRNMDEEGKVPDNTETCINVSADGYSRAVTVKTDGVSIGCQVIPRFEVEQVAILKGWDFPE